MKINLFELFEDLFEGTLYFFYNIIGTAWTLLRHPWAGPAQRVQARAAWKAARKQPGEDGATPRPEEAAGPKPPPQVGGLTFVFVCVFFSLLGRDLLPGGDLLLAWLRTILGRPGEIDLGPVWPAVLGALAAAALIDAASRLAILLLKLSPDTAPAGEPDALVDRIEYALVWPLLLFILLTVAITLTAPPNPATGVVPGWWNGLLFGGLLVVFASAYPVICQVRPKREIKGLAWLGEGVNIVFCNALVIGALSGAMIAALAIEQALQAPETGPAATAAAAGRSGAGG